MHTLASSLLVVALSACVKYDVSVANTPATIYVDGQRGAPAPDGVSRMVPVEVMVFQPGFEPVIVAPGKRVLTLAPIRPASETANPGDQRREGWGLLRAAAVAAATSDCTTVRELGVQLLAIDKPLHRLVFSRDLAIRQCLAPTAPDTPP